MIADVGRFNGLEPVYGSLARRMLAFGVAVNQPPHQMDSLKDDPQWTSVELRHVVFGYFIPDTLEELQDDVKPNLPWAEDHFCERVSGKPLNPPPSSEWWPYTQAGHEEHLNVEGKFSHTYPERMWSGKKRGIRFEHGDLDDLLTLLARHPYTRQAYLPIWFPEDLTAANRGERVPCTLGYHFMLREGQLDITYFIRSCDLIRFFRDDVYMACRLAQWVLQEIQFAGDANPVWEQVIVGSLMMHAVSLHCFEGDLPMLKYKYGQK